MAVLQPASAQSGYEGQITGTVTDPAGAIVVGAAVRLTDVSTAITTGAASRQFVDLFELQAAIGTRLAALSGA